MDMSMSGSRFLAWIVDTKQTLLNHGWWISQLTRKSRCEQYQGRDPSLPDTTVHWQWFPCIVQRGPASSSRAVRRQDDVLLTSDNRTAGIITHVMKRRVKGIIHCIPHFVQLYVSDLSWLSSCFLCLVKGNHGYKTFRLVSGCISLVDMFHVCFMSAMCAPWLHRACTVQCIV